MSDSFVLFKAIKNDACRDDVEPGYWSHSFVCRHSDQQNLANAINSAMNEIFQMQGMICVRDMSKPGGDHNNLFFVPLHMMARIDIQVRPIVGEYPDNPEGAVKQ